MIVKENYVSCKIKHLNKNMLCLMMKFMETVSQFTERIMMLRVYFIIGFMKMIQFDENVVR